MTNKYLEFGVDFAQDEYGEPILAQNGDFLSTVSGLETLENDVKNIVYMQKGENNRRPDDGVDWGKYENKIMTGIDKEFLRGEIEKMAISDKRVSRGVAELGDVTSNKTEYSIVFNPVGSDEIINIQEGREI